KKGFIILVSIAIMVFGSVSLFGQYGRGYGAGYVRGYGMGCNYGYNARYNNQGYEGRYYNQRFNGYNGCYYYNNPYVK
ncbi:hypothetical protein, partial [Brachyspira pilosicoli]